MNLEEIEERCNFVLTTNLDAMPQRIEAAEVILRNDIPDLIAEVKQLRWEKWELTNNYAELQTEVKRLREENERLDCENRQFKDYVINIGCSYTQTESDCECDYDYPWPCDHCPIVEHNMEHDQGESFLTQIKELREENERLQAELDGFIHGGL